MFLQGDIARPVPLIEKKQQNTVYQNIKLIFIILGVISTLWKPIILIGVLSKWLW